MPHTTWRLCVDHHQCLKKLTTFHIRQLINQFCLLSRVSMAKEGMVTDIPNSLLQQDEETLFLKKTLPGICWNQYYMIFTFCNKPDVNIKSKNKYVLSACPLPGISRLIRTAHTRTAVIKLDRQVVWLQRYSLEPQYIHSLCWQHLDSSCESLLAL